MGTKNDWCFALINGKLAEIFFNKKNKDTVYLNGYCYVKREEYKTKREQKMIDGDISKCRITYKNGNFSDKNRPEIKFISN